LWRKKRNEMSRVRSVDHCFGNTSKGEDEYNTPEVRVCEPAQVYNRRNTDWPFMYSYEKGRCFINTAPRQSAYAQAADAGEALM
jgi:hypothetical protein